MDDRVKIHFVRFLAARARDRAKNEGKYFLAVGPTVEEYIKQTEEEQKRTRQRLQEQEPRKNEIYQTPEISRKRPPAQDEQKKTRRKVWKPAVIIIDDSALQERVSTASLKDVETIANFTNGG